MSVLLAQIHHLLFDIFAVVFTVLYFGIGVYWIQNKHRYGYTMDTWCLFYVLTIVFLTGIHHYIHPFSSDLEVFGGMVGSGVLSFGVFLLLRQIGLKVSEYRQKKARD